MIIGAFKLLIFSPVDRAGLVAEIYADGQGVAEISEEIPGEFKIAIFPKRDGEIWSFDYKDFQAALSIAVTRLRDGG